MQFPSRAKSVIWGKRLILTVLIMGGLVYGVLAFAARSKEPIRLGLQDYLTEASGHPAEVTDMVTVKLVPDIVFRMKGIIIRNKDDRAKTMLKADHAYIAVPLWHVFFGIRSYLGFEVGGLEAASGFFLPKKLSLDFVGLSDPSGGVKAPQFLAEGRYNDRDLLITAEMIRKDRKEKPPLYRFDKNFRITAKLGLLQGEGVFMRGMTDVAFEDAIFHRDGDEAVFDVTDIERDPLHAKVEGTINAIPFKAELTPRILKITPGSSEEKDLKTLARFFAHIAKDMGVDGKPEIFKFEIATPETEKK
jgi:hypothetical protein